MVRIYDGGMLNARYWVHECLLYDVSRDDDMCRCACLCVWGGGGMCAHMRVRVCVLGKVRWRFRGVVYACLRFRVVD